MPMPRSSLVSLDATPYYHVISRCVRRQFLCGQDSLTGRDFSHRRDWIRKRIFKLRDIFAIEICAYAVMSNHFHLVVCVQQDRALGWSDQEVARRWLALFGGNPLVRALVNGKGLSEVQESEPAAQIKKYRSRLSDLSWFMRCLNEPIARRANTEDEVTGRFWEGRFKSQALLNEAALIAAMAYADLNPVRAGMANLPEKSDYTSIQQRVLERQQSVAENRGEAFEKPPEGLRTVMKKLMPFADELAGGSERHIPYKAEDYLELVDWSGRAIAEGKRGKIPEGYPPILERLNINPGNYLRFIERNEEHRFHNFIGPAEKLRDLAIHFSKTFLKGQTAAAQLFSPT